MISHGKIVKVRGNKGEVVLIPSPGRDFYIPGKGDALMLESARYRRAVEVEYAREISGACVLKFANIDTINEALKLVGYHVHTAPAAGGITAVNLTGFTVVDVTGREWGKVIDIDDSTLNKIIEVQDQDNVFYVPFTETIVKEIKNEQGIVIIDPPAGLRELNP